MPKVTFGIIVLNGEPFTRYCLRALYPFAHEIIVVEGGHEDTRSVATADGHSVDGTLEVLRRFCEDEDPLQKVTLVTRDGFWPKEDEMGRHRTPQSREYAKRATGDYLWQIDIDEFYLPGHMLRVLEMLADDPQISAVSFQQRCFWGSLDIQADGWALRRWLGQFHRLFKWGPGYRYVTHEPPTVVDRDGRDLRTLKWMRASDTAQLGIQLYHYSLLFPWQVEQKTSLYRDEKPKTHGGMIEWAETSFFTLGHPYHVHNIYQDPSWLRHYQGEHPAEVLAMMNDIENGRVQARLRDNQDANRLLESRWYRAGAFALSYADYVDRTLFPVRRVLRRVRRAPRKIMRELRSERQQSEHRKEQ